MILAYYETNGERWVREREEIASFTLRGAKGRRVPDGVEPDAATRQRQQHDRHNPGARLSDSERWLNTFIDRHPVKPEDFMEQPKKRRRRRAA